MGLEFTEGARCPGWGWALCGGAQGVWGRARSALGDSDPRPGSPPDLGPHGRPVGRGRAGHRATLSAPGRVAGGAAELTVAEEPGGAGTLGVVVLAELALVAAVAVAHAVAALALALPRARLVVTLPQARLRVAQRARGAVAVAAAPRRGATDSPTARGGGEAGLSPSPFTEEETEALRGHSSLSDWNLRPLRSPPDRVPSS